MIHLPCHFFLIGGLEHFLFSKTLGIYIDIYIELSQLTLMFFGGVETTNQLYNISEQFRGMSLGLQFFNNPMTRSSPKPHRTRDPLEYCTLYSWPRTGHVLLHFQVFFFRFSNCFHRLAIICSSLQESNMAMKHSQI